jgi:hypothetical protein
VFRTELTLSPSPNAISHQTPVLTTGSCFAQAIGSRLQRGKFKALTNPFGVIFNPLSVFRLLQYSIRQELPAEHTYLERQGIHLNYDLHSDFSSPDKVALQEKIRLTIAQCHKFLKESRYLILTLGTAIVYERQDNGETVANCHKMPASTFSKKLLSAAEITDAFQHIYKELKQFNPELKIIVTVSPVRHIKDTLELNTVSKSTLRLVTHELQKQYAEVEYFPSYEIMLDDLRDYRFYHRDMLHPTEQAEDYIWERFGTCYFRQETQDLLKRWEKLRQAVNHRPFHPESEVHQHFLKKTIQQLETLAEQIDVSKEIETLKQQLL